MNQPPLLELKHVSKIFPGVKALDQANLVLYPGEVLAICGENGAGKSTLMKCIAAIHRADEGEMYYCGQKVDFAKPIEAKKAGIVLIFQELSLVLDLSVAENIFLGDLPKTKHGLIDRKKLHQEAEKILNEIECPAPSTAIVRDLPIAQRQMVEISRAMAFGAKVVIFDEPTSSLTDKETKILFKCVRRLKEQGIGVIYITHKMDEVFEISDRIAVFRDGTQTGVLATREASIHDVTRLMVGREIATFFFKSHASIGETVLAVEHIRAEGVYEDVSFELHSGEILGLYGLVGAGRSEIAESIFGIRKFSSGTIRINGREVKIRTTSDALRYGIGFVPENRKEQGLILAMSCVKNNSLLRLPQMKKGMFIDVQQEERLFDEYREKLRISTPSGEQICGNLSGGNQQKIVIAKWLAMGPKILIMDEPTKGIDVSAKAEIHKLIAQIAESGVAVMVISSEMPEIMGVSNRILTVREGRINGCFEGEDITEENLIEAITRN